jgi:hypothetical protein
MGLVLQECSGLFAYSEEEEPHPPAPVATADETEGAKKDK